MAAATLQASPSPLPPSAVHQPDLVPATVPRASPTAHAIGGYLP